MCSSNIYLFTNHLNECEFFTFRQDLLEAFKNDILKNINKWDIIIVVGQKGLFIFEDMIQELDKNITYISNFEINSYGLDNFENKKILLFDDSINRGKTIGEKIDILLQYRTKSITVFSIASTVRRYNELVMKYRKYQNVEFMIYKKFSSKKRFCEFFLVYIREYLDFVCMPKYKRDLIVDEFIYSGKLSEVEVKNLFRTEKSIVETEGTFLQHKNRFKMVLEFCDEDYESLKRSVFPEKFDFELNPCKVRLYVHTSEAITKIFIEYIVLPELADFSICNKDLKNKYFSCSRKNENMNRNCLICTIYNLTEHVRKIILKKISEKKIRGDFKNVLWLYEGETIDLNNFE